jgi:hypothetical protein
MLHRSHAELERDIAEFLLTKYEDSGDQTMTRLFHRWIDECTSPTRASGAPLGTHHGLLQWIDRNALLMGVSVDDISQIGADIRTLLQSMAMPAAEFMCS